MECDAVLVSGSAVANESMLTGESIPVTKVSGVEYCTLIHVSMKTWEALKKAENVVSKTQGFNSWWNREVQLRPTKTVHPLPRDRGMILIHPPCCQWSPISKLRATNFLSDNARQSTVWELHESDCHQDWIYDHKGKGELTHFKLTATLRRKIIFMVLLTVFSGRASPRHSFPSSTGLCLLLRLFEERQVCILFRFGKKSQ